jgi:hypothetical protein
VSTHQATLAELEEEFSRVQEDMKSAKACAGELRGAVTSLSAGVEQVVDPDDSSLSSATFDSQKCNRVMKGTATATMRAAVGSADRALDRAEEGRKGGGSPGGSGGDCDPNYSGYCVPLVSYDLDCDDVGSFFTAVGSDEHGFDGDADGVACES